MCSNDTKLNVIDRTHPYCLMPTLLVSGFHRSGTSLACKQLHAAGCEFSELNNYNSPANPDGHFENQAMLQLHESILTQNDSSWMVSSAVEFTVNEKDKAAMRDLLAKTDDTRTLVCHKDPRSTLFLRDWATTDSNLKFLCLYRSYDACERSLLVREAREFVYNFTHQEKSLQFWLGHELGLRMWLEYNRRIVDFVKSYPDRVLLIRQDALIKDSPLPDRLNSKFNFDLSDIPNFTRAGFGENRGNELVEHSRELIEQCESMLNTLDDLSGYKQSPSDERIDTRNMKTESFDYDENLLTELYQPNLAVDAFYNADSNTVQEGSGRKCETKNQQELLIDPRSELGKLATMALNHPKNAKNWINFSVGLGDSGFTEAALRSRLFATKINLLRKEEHLNNLVNGVISIPDSKRKAFIKLSLKLLSDLPNNFDAERESIGHAIQWHSSDENLKPNKRIA